MNYLDRTNIGVSKPLLATGGFKSLLSEAEDNCGAGALYPRGLKAPSLPKRGRSYPTGSHGSTSVYQSADPVRTPRSAVWRLISE